MHHWLSIDHHKDLISAQHILQKKNLPLWVNGLQKFEQFPPIQRPRLKLKLENIILKLEEYFPFQVLRSLLCRC